ncbi:MAG: hypothetical protein LBM19_02095 [Holosporales bacterium]|nr:hypothetical protein [Holosporales bacterium]
MFYLTDRPINKELFLRIYAAIAEAIGKWEPRFKLEKIELLEVKEGRVAASLSGVYLPIEQRITLESLTI